MTSLRAIVLVVGMHRSGTSLVARGLATMGANLGERVDTTPHHANPHGHWEHADVWQGQESLLIRFGREWHSSPGPLPQRWLEWPDTRATIDRFSAIAAIELGRHGHWVVKDPRSSLLIPLWRDVAARVGVPLRLVRMVRGAEDVAASLAARDGMPRTLALRIWSDHQHRIDRDGAGLDTLTVSHRTLMGNPQATFARMAAFCGLSDPDQRSVRAAALVDAGLWHHREATHAGAADGPAPDMPPVPPPIVPAARGHVDIVMRTRWRLHMLPRALRSVLSQTYPHWVLQIVNDGGPPHLIEHDVAPYRHLFEGRLRILHRDRQYGMEAASNAGIAATSGDFIAIHDDDDAWAPEFLERMVSRLHGSTDVAVVSRSRLVWECWQGGEYVRQRVDPFGPDLDCVTGADLQVRNLFPPISLLFRRSAYDTVGPFHEALPALGDWHFNRRLAACGSIAVVPETLAEWHRRDVADHEPNSPFIDHLRMNAWVAGWPHSGAPPEFFSQACQVRVWGDGSSLVGFTQGPIPSGEESPLDPGLYLLRVPSSSAGAPGAVSSFVYAVRSTGRVAEVPLVGDTTSHATVLLNATEPVGRFGLRGDDGVVRPVAVETVVVRLGDALRSLRDFAGPPRVPDALCIGAQRAGTTWLYHALQRHPGMWVSGVKELHQCDWDGEDPVVGEFRQRQALAVIGAHTTDSADPDREWRVRMAVRLAFPPSHSWENYAAMFEAAPGDRVVCDYTPAYATLDDATVAEVVRVMPQVKVLLVLRDPVERAVSGALHALQRAGVSQPTEDDVRREAATEANTLRTDYRRTLDIWQRHLPPGQLLVLFHDEVLADPTHVMQRVCTFLGLAPMPTSLVADGPLGPVNTRTIAVAWPAVARVKAELSERWLPMIAALEPQWGEPVRQWRVAAEARVRAAAAAEAGAAAGGDHTVLNNLAQWDSRDPWELEGDGWVGQAKVCGVPYVEWKAGIMARYRPLFPRGGTWLEIGSGHGRWSEALIEESGLLVLCDISPNCLDACRQRLVGKGRLRTHVSLGGDLPADLTGRVDAVWSYDCFVHMGPAECGAYLSEIARVLRPGGVAVIHHADRARTWWQAFLREPLWGWSPRRPETSRETGWRSPVTRADVRRWARASGLVVVRQERTWRQRSAEGTVRIGVPRFGDCLTVLRRAAK